MSKQGKLSSVSSRLSIGVFFFCSLLLRQPSKVTAMSTTFIDTCTLSESQYQFQFDEGLNRFIRVNINNNNNKNDNDNDQDGDAVDNDNDRRGRTLLRNQSFLNTSSLPKASSMNEINHGISYSRKQDDSTNKPIVIGRECKCATQHRQTQTFCLVQHNENHCRVPNSHDLPVECYHSSFKQIFITNAWPLSIIWILALTIYLVSTEIGRCTIKYVLSKICCPCGGAFNNSRLIDNIVSREVSMRDLHQIASLTRAAQQQITDGRGNANNPITYILKTKEYSSNSGNKRKYEGDMKLKEKTIDDENDIEMTSFREGLIHESPSNDTAITSPYSFSSSPSFSDAPIESSPTASASFAQSSADYEDDEDLQQPLSSSQDNLRCVACSTPSPDSNMKRYPSKANYDEDYDDEEEAMCTICMIDIEDGDRVGVLPCEHLFHADCLKEWIKRRNVCPLCQTTIAEERMNSNASDDNAPTVRVRYPASFTVRTTGSPAELASRRRTRRRPATTTTTTTTTTTVGLGTNNSSNNETVRRQLFRFDGEGRIPSRIASSAGVTLITTQGRGNNRSIRVLVGDAARSETSSYA